MSNKKSKENRIPELLAPAGGKEAFIAAVESGADAIYTGGEFLNARMGAGNFSMSEMEEAVDFAHKRHVKVYATVNTLVKEEEIGDAVSYCEKLWEMGMDALIIQDLGLGYLVKKYIPDMSIHLSTQGSIYDIRGVEAAAKLGYERVVAARELSLKEIEEICRGNTEIEVFCHGALCICYSGQCQMSRAIGGRSGNRGTCAQPCRLVYETAKGSAYALSPSDLNWIDLIGALSSAGVSSLKIEGRMKSPDYVSVVTSVYRKYLDIYKKTGSYSVSSDDRNALTQIFNRGFTEGYAKEKNPPVFMSLDQPKNKGVYIGEINHIKSVKGKSGRKIIRLTSDSSFDKETGLPISMGDIMEVRNNSTESVTRESFVVTLIEAADESGKNVTGKNNVWIGDAKGNVNKGDAVYRIVSGIQLEDASRSYKNKDWHQGKYNRKSRLSAYIISTDDGMIKLSLKDIQTGATSEVVSGPFDIAENKPTSEETIKASISKMGDTSFTVDDYVFKGNFNLFIPVSVLNAMRRKAVSGLEEKLCFKGIDVGIPESISMGAEENIIKKGSLELFFYSVDEFIASNVINEIALIKKSLLSKYESDVVNCVKVLLPAAELIDRYDEVASGEAEIIPYISSISKGKENSIIEKRFDDVCSIAVETGIYIGNINWINEFASKGIKVLGDYGINMYNPWTEVAIKKLGAFGCVSSLESVDVRNEYVGRFPLMVSQHSFDIDEMTDRKGVKYSIIKRGFSDQDVLVIKNKNNVIKAIGEALERAASEQKSTRLYI